MRARDIEFWPQLRQMSLERVARSFVRPDVRRSSFKLRALEARPLTTLTCSTTHLPIFTYHPHTYSRIELRILSSPEENNLSLRNSEAL